MFAREYVLYMSSCKRKVYIIHSNYLRCSLGGFFNMSEERNIYQILRNIAQNDPDHLILTDAYDDFTYSDLVQMTDSFTGVLLKKGIPIPETGWLPSSGSSRSVLSRSLSITLSALTTSPLL